MRRGERWSGEPRACAETCADPGEPRPCAQVSALPETARTRRSQRSPGDGAHAVPNEPSRRGTAAFLRLPRAGVRGRQLPPLGAHRPPEGHARQRASSAACKLRPCPAVTKEEEETGCVHDAGTEGERGLLAPGAPDPRRRRAGCPPPTRRTMRPRRAVAAAEKRDDWMRGAQMSQSDLFLGTETLDLEVLIGLLWGHNAFYHMCGMKTEQMRDRVAPGTLTLSESGAKTVAESEYESVLCVKPDVSTYRIPPWASNHGYRASDWKSDRPDWTGRLRIASEGKTADIKLQDKVSGELFAQAPVEQYPGIAVETVTDSSCYFVIWIQDGTGHSAFIGIGFTDRGDAFDFNVSSQDHFKWVKQESESSKESQEMDTRPKLDLGFEEGQIIKLSIGNITSKKGGASKPRTSGAGGLSLHPPPPGGKVTIPPLSSSVAISNHVTPPPIPKSNHGGSDADNLLDLDSPAPIMTPAPAPISASNDLRGDFSTASSSSVPNQAPQPSNWV
ncbi:adaptin ear-binding coat-associated protein 1-like [Cynocephalus volans]|uniref:adaptin ear-binding coat-associated protein 1-like n=1 Tax=Cynocephalus volans TaxID=110931 RepID=UPI002FCB69C0